MKKQRQTKDELTLTQNELDILISLTEMTEDGSGCTFGEWLDSNPQDKEVLAILVDKLKRFDKTA